MAGLFSTPEQVAAQMAQQRAQLAQLPNPSAGGLFNLGTQIGRATRRGISGAFGEQVETRDPEELRAIAIQEQMSGLDFGKRQTFIDTANRLKEKGNFTEAFAIMGRIPDVPESEVTFGDSFLRTTEQTNPDGTIKYITQRFQIDSDGQERSIGGAVTSDREPTGDGDKPPKFSRLPAFTSSQPMTSLIEESIVASAQDMWGLDENDVKLEGIAGKVLSLASGNRDKSQLSKIADGTINTSPVASDFTFVQEAVNQILESGTLTDFITFNDYMNNQVALNPSFTRTGEELKKLKAQQEKNKKIRQAHQDVVKQIKRGDVTKGELNLRNIPVDKGVAALSNFETDDFDTIMNNFRAQGIDVQEAGPALQGIQQQIMWMKQVPEFSRAWLDARGGDTGMLATSKRTNRRNLFAETSKRLLDENRMQEFWVVTSVNQWLNRMKRAKTPTTEESILKFTPTGEEAA